MTARVLEAVPNFSEGRDGGVVDAIVRAAASAGVEVLDRSSDPDHNRSVVTFIGSPEAVEEAAVAAAAVAVERIDLTRHRGVHPRIGALDVLPFVPVSGLDLADARASARRVGGRLAHDVGVPVYFYGAASDPPGRALAELRRGGFETLVQGWPRGRAPDLAPPAWEWPGAHPSAGATAVGARPPLLAWNVVLAGVSLDAAVGIAAAVRESGGGFRGVRALGLALDSRGAVQVSMNLEDPARTSPMAVFERLETLVSAAGGQIVETEVIGMIPDEFLLSVAADRLRLRDASPARLLSRRVLDHVARMDGARQVGEE